jgi:hypothetical protein
VTLSPENESMSQQRRGTDKPRGKKLPLPAILKKTKKECLYAPFRHIEDSSIPK